MFEKEILSAAKFSIDMISKMNTSKIMEDTGQSVRACAKSIDLVNEKLDMMTKSMGNIVFGRLKSANLSFEDFLSSDNFTDSNIQLLKELYISNTGLPLDERTGEYSNNDMIVYSYLGLILLENYTKQNQILIFRYIMRMFYANSIIAEQYFPEVYNSFFKEYVLLYSNQEFKLLNDNQFNNWAFENIYEEIGKLIEFYDINIEVVDWAEGAEKWKEKLFGKLLNKLIGPVNISSSNCNRIFVAICSFSHHNKNYSLKAVGNIITKLTCSCILNKFNENDYVAKRQVKITRLLSDNYLKCMISDCIG